MRRLAIIPARGGSKRVPDKNIRDFCGRPMIGHILQTAKASNLFDVIHVSTENDKIKRVVESLGFEIDFDRPEDLADDYTPLMPVLKFVTEKYVSLDQTFDQVWLLMPCSPLIETIDLLAASKLFERHNGEYAVMSAAVYSTPIERAFTCDVNGSMTPLDAKALAIRTQDLEDKYYDAGAFEILSSKDVLGSEDTVATEKYLAYVLPKFKSIDIDDGDDFALAEMIYRGYHHTSV